MSAPPNALATGDMAMLSPGEQWRGSWGIEPQ
jgi:hypothetical protein